MPLELLPIAAAGRGEVGGSRMPGKQQERAGHPSPPGACAPHAAGGKLTKVQGPPPGAPGNGFGADPQKEGRRVSPS